MYHLVLAMPFLGLMLFAFLPFRVAVSLYGVVFVLSFGAYFLIIRASKRRVVSGLEGMIGATVEALEDFTVEGKVRYGGEIWNARSSEPIRKGEEAVITSVRGLQLTVSRGGRRELGKQEPDGAGRRRWVDG